MLIGLKTNLIICIETILMIYDLTQESHYFSSGSMSMINKLNFSCIIKIFKLDLHNN